MSHASRSIFLIHPLGETWIPGESNVTRIANIMPPLGLCCLAAWVRQHGHRAAIHDCYAFPGQDERILERIGSERPDFIGFTATTNSFPDAVRLMEMIRAVHPTTPFVIGGAHFAAMPADLMRDYPLLDYGVLGEGEQTLLALMNADPPETIPGLYYREGGAVRNTGWRSRKEMVAMDDLPFPAYELLEGFPEAYKLPLFNYPKAPNTTVVASRGCPYECSYCDRTIFGKTYRGNSPEYLIRLLTHLKERYGIRHVNFYDDLFTLNRKRILRFCELLMESGLGITYNCAARAEHVDPEMLAVMKRSGCWMISLGIETGDPELLKMHRSNSDLEMVRKAVWMIRDAGIRAKGLFIVGLPGETEQSIDTSIDYALSLPLNEINVAKFTPFPGTPLYPTVRAFGEFDENWALMNCMNFLFIPRGFTRERLEERYWEFNKRHYERPRVLLGYLAMIWHSPDSWLRFLAGLKTFLGVAIRHRSRRDRRS